MVCFVGWASDVATCMGCVSMVPQDRRCRQHQLAPELESSYRLTTGRDTLQSVRHCLTAVSQVRCPGASATIVCCTAPVMGGHGLSAGPDACAGASASPADPAEQHHHASSPDHAPTSRLELAGSYHTALGVAPSSNSVKSCAAGSASGGPLSPHPPAAQPAPLSSQPCASEHAAHSHANAASALVDPAPAGLGVRLEPVPYSRADVALAASLGAFLSSQLWQQSGLAPKTREPAAMSEAVALAV